MPTHDTSRLIDRYFDMLEIEGHYTPASHKTMRYQIERFQRWLGDRRLADVDAALLREYLACSDHLKLATQQGKLGAVRGFFDWLVVQRYVKTNPADKVRLRKHPAPPPFVGTLTPLVAAFLVFMESRGHYSESSIPRVRSRLTHLARFVGDRPLQDLDADLADLYVQSLIPYKLNTRNAMLNCVKTFGRWLADEGHLEANPAQLIRLAPEPPPKPRALSPDAVAATLAACRNDRERAIIWLMVGLGLRTIEVSRAQWTDYNEATRTLLVRGKGGFQRLLPVDEPVADALAAIRLGRRLGPIISDNRLSVRPASPRAVGIQVAETLRRAGVKQRTNDGIASHALRHTAANDVLRRSGELRAVQRMLGHVRIATTMRYVEDIDIDDLRVAMAGRDYTPHAPVAP